MAAATKSGTTGYFFELVGAAAGFGVGTGIVVAAIKGWKSVRAVLAEAAADIGVAAGDEFVNTSSSNKDKKPYSSSLPVHFFRLL